MAKTRHLSPKVSFPFLCPTEAKREMRKRRTASRRYYKETRAQLLEAAKIKREAVYVAKREAWIAQRNAACAMPFTDSDV